MDCDRILRHTLRANAAFSAVSAAALLLGSSALEGLLGAPRGVLLGIGAGLALFVVDLLVTAARSPVPRGKAYYFLALDVGWVVGSAIMLLVPTPLTPTGRIAVAGVALVVAGFAAVQFGALRGASSHARVSAPDAPDGAVSP